jgi:hypothetical protein
MKTSMFIRVCAFLGIGAGVVFAANGADATAKWTYENNVLTGIPSDGETATVLTLTDDGALNVKTAGSQKEIDLRKAAMPSGVSIPAIKTIGNLWNLKASLQKVYLPESAKVISGSAFKNCTALKYVKLPEGLEVIGGGAFQGCTALELVEPCLPGSVTNIGTYAFQCCSAMTNGVEIGFGSQEVKFEYDQWIVSRAFQQCSKMPYLRLGPGVYFMPAIIDNNAAKLGEIEFGVNVTNFSDNFSSCGSLTNVIFKRTEDFAFRAYQGSSDTGTFHVFGNTLRTYTFSGWYTYSKGNGNPWQSCWNLWHRFIVPGDNAKWAAFMADETKMTPWEKCSDSDKNTYTNLFGENAQVPVGIGLAVPEGEMKRFILTDGKTYTGNTILMGGDVRSEFGTVTMEPAPAADGTYEAGTQVKVTFVPANEKVVFTGWTGSSSAAESEITMTVNGVLTLVPTFTAEYLVYDEAAGELTDGNWVMCATGERSAISVKALLRTVGTTKVDIDLTTPILGGGTITKFLGFGGKGEAISSIKLPETVEVMSGMNGDNLSNKPAISPLFPSNLVELSAAALHKHTAQTGNMRIGFAKDGDGNVRETTVGVQGFDFCEKMGPIGEIGPGVKRLPKWSFIYFGKSYGGAIELRLGEGLEYAAGTSFLSIGNVCDAKASNPITVRIAGEMFDGSSMMFSDTSFSGDKVTSWGPSHPQAYWMRFYVGADGCTQWHEFLESTKGEGRKIIPWAELDETVQNEYWTRFPKGDEFGTKRPYGLTTDAAVMTNGVASAYGLPANQWVFSLKTSGMVIRIQ